MLTTPHSVSLHTLLYCLSLVSLDQCSPGTFLFVPTREWGRSREDWLPLGISGIKAKDAVQHRQYTASSPPTNNYLAKNVNSNTERLSRFRDSEYEPHGVSKIP